MIVEKYSHQNGIMVIPELLLKNTLDIFENYGNVVTKSNVAKVKPDIKNKMM